MNINWRSWHAWLSVILSLPLFLVGMTAILLAHHKTLGLNAIQLNADWLPGNQGAMHTAPEIKASLIAADGRQYLGTKAGLFVLDRGRLLAVAALAGFEVRSLAENGPLLLAGGNRGVWRRDADVWRQIHAGTVHSVQISSHGIIHIATPDQGLLVSHDGGQTWSPNRLPMNALRQLPPESIHEDYTAGRLIMDVHTGKAFLGKRWEWLWIDLLGSLLVFLCLSGVYLWWRGQRRQAGRIG